MHIQTNKMAIKQKKGDMTDRIAEAVPGCLVKDVDRYRSDWWVAYRIDERLRGNPVAAVEPKCKDDLLKILRFARDEGIAILPRGGGSSVTGASVSKGGIVIDMSQMSSLISMDTDNRTITVQSGARLETVEKALNKKGYTLGQFPQSFELATVGGYISTMGTGHFSSFYGGIEESVLRLEIMLPTGELIRTRTYGVPRSSAGPDLSKLFIGAEGAFGIITEAELKIYPVQRHSQAAVYGFDTFEEAVNAVKFLNDIDLKPQLCRVYNETESSFYFGTGKSIVLLSYASNNLDVLSSTVSELSEVILAFWFHHCNRISAHSFVNPVCHPPVASVFISILYQTPGHGFGNPVSQVSLLLLCCHLICLDVHLYTQFLIKVLAPIYAIYACFSFSILDSLHPYINAISLATLSSPSIPLQAL